MEFQAIHVRLDEHTKTLAEHSKTLEEYDKRFDNIILELVDHGQRLEYIEENMATKADLRDLAEKMDKLIGFYQHDNQEVTLLAYALSRHDSRIQMLEDENVRIKFKINLE